MTCTLRKSKKRYFRKRALSFQVQLFFRYLLNCRHICSFFSLSGNCRNLKLEFLFENNLTCPELMWRPVFNWGQSFLAGRHHITISAFPSPGSNVLLSRCLYFQNLFLLPPSPSGDSRASWDVGDREVCEGWCLKYMLWVHLATEGFKVRRELANCQANCMIDERCPVNMASLFLKDGKDAAGARTQGPCGADIRHPLQWEAFAWDCSGQDPECHWLPKGGLDPASCCPSDGHSVHYF